MTGYARTAKKKGIAMKNKNQEMTRRPQVNEKRPLLEDDWLMENSEPAPVALRFSPIAWAKLLYFRDKSDNEVGGFGITDPDDLLFVRDFVIVKQEVTCISVKFDDEAVGQFFDEQVDLGRKPEQFARIWLHSHPGASPEPSGTDEETFERVFGGCQWAAMVIVAQDDSTYARLSFNVGPGGQVLILAGVDYSRRFGSSDHDGWDAEYAANVRAADWLGRLSLDEEESADRQLRGRVLPYDFLDEFEKMEPAERQFILDGLAERPQLYDEESEVMLHETEAE
jgi:proteasome lid subunit RPN8/RPN11